MCADNAKKSYLRANGRMYTKGEEIANSVSHIVGGLLAIAGIVIAIVFAAMYGDAWGVVSASIYGSMLIIAYTMSSLYHALTHKGAKKVFRIFDHCSIFLLIAGTYTPFTLVTLRGAIGWTLFGIVWASAVLGIVLNSISIEKFQKFSMICYVGMGWAIVGAIMPLMNALDVKGMILLVLGGISYTVGIIFYRMKSVPYMHAVWHLFVLAGSILHYFSILFYVLPTK